MNRTEDHLSPWRYKNVFVTGCTGLLGSWLTKRLVDVGAHVIGLIRDWVPQSHLILEGTIHEITTVRGAVEDYWLLERTLNEYEIEVVFHTAAQTIVGTANRSPLGTFETNIRGTWNLLEACRNTRHVKRIIVASSDKAYGPQTALPYTEETPLLGRHPYDVSKSCADLICQAYAYSYRLPVCVTRCGNFFGGGDLNSNRLVPGTILSALRRERPIIRSDGNYIRDYLYIEDGVESYLRLAEKMTDPSLHGHAFNFSYERPLRVKEMVSTILSIMQSDLKPKILNQATNEIITQHLAAQKARELLGWTPKYTLEEGLLKTVEWYKTHLSNGTLP